MVSPSHKKTSRPVCRRTGAVLDAAGLPRGRVGDLELLSSAARPPRSAAAARAGALSPCRNSNPRWGYRLIHQLLCREGWTVNRKRVQRVRRQAGLGVPPVERRKRRPRSAQPTPVQAAYPGHVWSWDFILDRTTDGRPVKMLTVVDEYTRQCLVIHPARSIPSDHVLDTLQALVEAWGAPAFMRSG